MGAGKVSKSWLRWPRFFREKFVTWVDWIVLIFNFLNVVTGFRAIKFFFYFYLRIGRGNVELD